MIEMTLAQIHHVTGGELRGNSEIVVSGPAYIDSRDVTAGSLFAAFVGENTDGHQYARQALDSGAAAVLSTAPVDGPGIVVDDVAQALRALAHDLGQRLRHDYGMRVVAITGSSGKTTVKDMVAHVLDQVGPTIAPRGSLNNELGVPLTVLRATADTRFLVLEMGARGVGHIETLCQIVRPDVSVVTNVGLAHAGEFGSIEMTAKAKGEIVDALNTDGVAVLNADDPLVAAMAQRSAGRVMTFGETADVHVSEMRLTAEGFARCQISGPGFSTDVTIPQLGWHQGSNGAAAVAVALGLGLDPKEAAEALGQAEPRSGMRMERHRAADGVWVINDAYNANPESMEASLRTVAAMEAPCRIAVLGPMRELGDDAHLHHRQIGELAAQLGFDQVVAVGQDAAAMALGAGGRGKIAKDVDEAVALVADFRADGAIVLVKASRGARLERVAHRLLEV